MDYFGTMISSRQPNSPLFLCLPIYEVIEITATGRYIDEDDVSNWADGVTEAQKQKVINRMEEQIERNTKDIFYEKKFTISIDGNGSDRLFLPFNPNLLSVSEIKVANIVVTTNYYTHDKWSVYRDTTTATSEAELRWLLGQYLISGLFVKGIKNVQITGTYGWPERLDMDNVSGIFEAEETITGGTSGATAAIEHAEDDYLIIRGRSSTNFRDNEEITGGTSAATADVNGSGVVTDPPEAILKATIVLCEDDNDETLYDHLMIGSESLGGWSYDLRERPLTGVREADRLLRDYVRKKPQIGVV